METPIVFSYNIEQDVYVSVCIYVCSIFWRLEWTHTPSFPTANLLEDDPSCVHVAITQHKTGNPFLVRMQIFSLHFVDLSPYLETKTDYKLKSS